MKPALQFTKTPLSVITAKGATACFCARAQCGKTIEIIWTINGKDARENAKCKVRKIKKCIYTFYILLDLLLDFYILSTIAANSNHYLSV